jgi:catechol 2,3-dioxygenase-like lactoylglutathione lyase family enzyme
MLTYCSTYLSKSIFIKGGEYKCHVQIYIPFGQEKVARNFYTNILGLQEIEKPGSLKSNGGIWYQAGDIELHIGVENMEHVQSKRHPAFEVENVDEVRRYLESHGIQSQDEKPIPNVKRFSFFDPFGNRIELLEKVIGKKKQP